jgi:hypothetical protein
MGGAGKHDDVVTVVVEVVAVGILRGLLSRAKSFSDIAHGWAVRGVTDGTVHVVQSSADEGQTVEVVASVVEYMISMAGSVSILLAMLRAGERVNMMVGRCVGRYVGIRVGRCVGRCVGRYVGRCVGRYVGRYVGS